MGNTKNPQGKRIFDDTYSFPQDSQDLADDIFEFANARVGTSSERQSLPAAKQRVGMLWTETDTGFTFVNRGSGDWTLISGPTPYLVARSTVQIDLPTGGWVTLGSWEAPTTQRGIDFNQTTGLVTIRRDGVYDLDGFVSIAGGGAVGNRVSRLTRNGFADADAIAYNLLPTNSAVTMPVRRTMPLVAGDVIRLMALQSSGGTLKTIIATPGYEQRLSVRFIADS